MAEWLKAPVLKTVRVERLSGVRIPLPPPFQLVDMDTLGAIFVRRKGPTPTTAIRLRLRLPNLRTAPSPQRFIRQGGGAEKLAAEDLVDQPKNSS